MKITAIVRHASNDDQTAFRTEPALTQEVFNYALEHFFGEQYYDSFYTTEGMFIARRVGIPKIQIEEWEGRLTDAKRSLGQAEARKQQERDATLQARAEMAGLPLE